MKVVNLFTVFFLAIALCSVQACKEGGQKKKGQRSSEEAQIFIDGFKKSNFKVKDREGNEISSDKIKFEREWKGNICKSKLTNTSDDILFPKDVILFEFQDHGLDPESPVYGEGFQMLHQNGGSLGKPENIGKYSDKDHYRIPNVDNLPTAYGMLNVNIKEDENLLLGFTSCHKFIGRISYDRRRMLISLDTEGLILEPGESWELEDFMLDAGVNEVLYGELVVEINKNHPPRRTGTIPTGWCSWYCYGPDVTNEIIKHNLDVFATQLPELKYIQLDDGYQPFMGDWLDPNPAYGNVRETIDDIRKKGFEPAIWVAPFIAQKESKIFREHPNWFVKNSENEPLNSSTVGFGGWRNGPWYSLDGSNPEVQRHLENIFKVMREEWGVNYFKLDANYWGAIHGGFHYDSKATRIQAYRQGMEAVLRGCDENTVVLGCNAPIWPSFGLVTAMRTSGDISRTWEVIKTTAYENLYRSWQNGRIWDSDPDCVVLADDTIFNGEEEITEDEWMFHATAIHAVGGLILSGDKAVNLNEKELDILKKLLVPTGKGASFNTTTLETGLTDLGDRQYYYFFNWGEVPVDLSVQLKTKGRLVDFWTGEALGVHEGRYSIKNIPPHSARLLMAVTKNVYNIK
ncbi:glycoside hydrolase family 36 protein [Arenibacter palladensis]|uniref:glycoside hydrolase family 36 protein n=1 Tax=Arenibacter palladensis TaxID=237373 RepID=UPI0026E25AA1|nr:glycoside hydrolase family 36 protein [Arenibacter palladensis]MDO6605646.1 alpha-galactosidase [Arenibacter palladensis]